MRTSVVIARESQDNCGYINTNVVIARESQDNCGYIDTKVRESHNQCDCSWRFPGLQRLYLHYCGYNMENLWTMWLWPGKPRTLSCLQKFGQCEISNTGIACGWVLRKGSGFVGGYKLKQPCVKSAGSVMGCDLKHWPAHYNVVIRTDVDKSEEKETRQFQWRDKAFPKCWNR